MRAIRVLAAAAVAAVFATLGAVSASAQDTSTHNVGAVKQVVLKPASWQW